MSAQRSLFGNPIGSLLVVGGSVRLGNCSGSSWLHDVVVVVVAVVVVVDATVVAQGCDLRLIGRAGGLGGWSDRLTDGRDRVTIRAVWSLRSWSFVSVGQKSLGGSKSLRPRWIQIRYEHFRAVMLHLSATRRTSALLKPSWYRALGSDLGM